MIKEISVLMIEAYEFSLSKHNKDYLEELTKDINERGLIHPILVRPLRNGKYRCIDGAFRLAAYEELKRPTIPCRVHNDSK